jgi:DNA-binding CsgD family transcriptional regulator
LRYGEEALELGTEVGSLEKQRDANLTLSEITEQLSAYEQSLAYYKSYTSIRDSLHNVEKSRQITELQTIYETEKKDQEIKFLAQSIEIDRIRKTRLWIAFGFTLLAGGLLLYAQRVRRIRDRKILAQEHELEVQKRRTVELEKAKLTRELDFKKQELAAKALQLARKNEFLQSLNEEVDNLRTGEAAPMDNSVRRISRRIRKDIESEEEWEQFLSSFREVHHDFIENLQLVYPGITKSELRLACLMKMNLSGKEIAAMLNITQEGVKKSRYRLRKKLDLNSNVDIQQFLLGLSRSDG